MLIWFLSKVLRTELSYIIYIFHKLILNFLVSFFSDFCGIVYKESTSRFEYRTLLQNVLNAVFSLKERFLQCTAIHQRRRKKKQTKNNLKIEGKGKKTS